MAGEAFADNVIPSAFAHSWCGLSLRYKKEYLQYQHRVACPALLPETLSHDTRPCGKASLLLCRLAAPSPLGRKTWSGKHQVYVSSPGNAFYPKVNVIDVMCRLWDLDISSMGSGFTGKRLSSMLAAWTFADMEDAVARRPITWC